MKSGFLPMFQFHTGSIKSGDQRGRTRCCEGFNSTLVRLKDSIQETIFGSNIGFNSTLVRLKGAEDGLVRKCL